MEQKKQKNKIAFARKLEQLPLHVKGNLQKDNQPFKFGDSFHCGIVESLEKSSRFECCSMTRQSMSWNSTAWPMRAFQSCGSVSTPVITEALSRWDLRSGSDSALERFLLLRHTVRVSVASAAQSQVKYPPPTVQCVRGSCPPRPLSL